jgi:hypothetical protein
MCTTTTRLHSKYQHPTTGTAGPPTKQAVCALARQQSSPPCPEAQQFTASAIDFKACDYCDRCLLENANASRKNGMDPEAYVRSHGNDLAAILEFMPPGWTWSDLD